MRLAALLCLLALSGCVTTTQMAPADAADVMRLTDGKPVVVSLRDGRRMNATALRIDADSASWVDVRTGDLRRFATADVALVTRRRHGQGALEGLGLGFVAGPSTLAAVGFLASSPCGDSSAIYCGREAGAYLGALGGLLVGPPLGLLFGAMAGHRDRYVLLPPAR